METFSVSLALCARDSPVTDEFPAQKTVTRSFDVFFDLRLNKRLSKQSWGWRFETPLAHYDVIVMEFVCVNVTIYPVAQFECHIDNIAMVLATQPI